MTTTSINPETAETRQGRWRLGFHLRRQLVGFIHELRTLDLKKQPSVSETIDWARVLVLLEAAELGHDMVRDTLNVLLKYESDVEAALPHVTSFVAKAARQNVFG